jgi:hypothetical protein
MLTGSSNPIWTDSMLAHSITARVRQVPICFALLFAVPLLSISRADEPPGPPTGQVRLAGGRVVEYTVPFDRNSLQDSLRVGNSLIALTSSGALLRFELPEVRLVREHVEPQEVICLGRGEGAGVLAGLADGRICRINPETLELTEVVKLPAPPRWIGWLPAKGDRPPGMVVLTGQTRSRSTVHDLAASKTFTLDYRATAFLLDSTATLWLGADNGEWGGLVTRVDLVKGTSEAIKPPPSQRPEQKDFWRGIYGFIELQDRQVWAFGGTSHMGFNSRNITRVDENKARPVFELKTHAMAEEKPDAAPPALPISHIIEEKESLLVFSFDDVFRVDKALKSWKKAATLSLEYRWGRPDAMGSYPSVRTVAPPSRDGEPYILATSGDGFVLLVGDKATSHSLPGQLGADSIIRVQNTAEGTLFFEQDDPDEGEWFPPWTLGAGGWKLASLEPHAEVAPAKKAVEDAEDDPPPPDETRVLVDPASGEIYTVTGTGTPRGTFTTTRRSAGKTVVLGRETTSLQPKSCFIAAGTLWYAAYEELKRFENGRWKTVSPLPDARGRHQMSPINTNGPPWLLLDTAYHTLWRFEHGAHAENPRLTRLVLKVNAKPLQTSAAIPWSNGAVLLATDQGLRVLNPTAGTVTKVDFPEPQQQPQALARDALRRLWLGGENGLWLVDTTAKTLESLEAVPSIRRNTVHSLATDPHHEDGVIVALGSNGVVFVRAPRKP